MKVDDWPDGVGHQIGPFSEIHGGQIQSLEIGSQCQSSAAIHITSHRIELLEMLLPDQFSPVRLGKA